MLAARVMGRSAGASWSIFTDRGYVLDGATEMMESGIFSVAELDASGFLVPLGDSFEIRYRYDLFVGGAGDATSRAEITESVIAVTATVVPEPSTVTLIALGVLPLIRRRG